MRNLRVIRLDDGLRGPIPHDEYDPEDGDFDVVLPPLELVTIRDGDQYHLGISGLAGSELFWEAFHSDQLPDIVVGDVNFEYDLSSPLRRWDPEHDQIPTGLSHLKPVAAVARASGRLIAIGIHTADPNKWMQLKIGGGKGSIYGLMAESEIRELAAILGERIAPDNEEEGAWNWLKEKAESKPFFALNLALRQYRRRMVERLKIGLDGSDQSALRLPVGEWEKLEAWCSQMKNGSKTLRESDPGFPLLYANGEVDVISFASLFADVDGILDEELPAECFELQEPEGKLWDLKLKLPQIGALIYSLADFKEVYQKAAAVRQELPFSETQLSHNLREVTDHPLARGFAVLFRYLEMVYEDEVRWDRLLFLGPWDPLTQAESEHEFPKEEGAPYSESCPVSLYDWLTKLDKVLKSRERSACDEETDRPYIDVVDLKDELGRAWDPASIRFHLELLCSMGRVERNIRPECGAEYRSIPGKSGLKSPQQPAECKIYSKEYASTLRDSLGFGRKKGPKKSNADNAVGQVLQAAFVGAPEGVAPNDSAKMGRQFLKSFVEGSAPGWIKEVCRDYVEKELGWKDKRTWPDCISD